MKRINIKKIFLLFIMMLPQIVLAEGYAYRGKELKVVYIIGVALLVIRIAVPILLIVMASTDLVKALVQNDENDIKKVLKGIVPKVIISIIIFVLPTVLLLILKLTNSTSLFSSYSTCLLKPSSCNIQIWEDPPEIEETSSKDPVVIVQPENTHYDRVDYSKFKWTYYKANESPIYESYKDAMPYAIWAPEDLKDLNGVSLPLIIWLHGADELTYQENGTPSKFIKSGLPKVLNNWSNTNLKPIPAIIIAPHSSGRWGNHENHSDMVKALIEYASSKYNIDMNNVVLMGHSMGGRGVIILSYQMQEKYSHNYFSAIVPMSPVDIDGPYPEKDQTNGYNYFSKMRIRAYSEYSEKNGFFDWLNKNNDYFYMKGISHGNVPYKALTMDENNDGISDLVSWMFNLTETTPVNDGDVIDSGTLKIYFLAYGRYDSYLIVGNGSTIFIDGGYEYGGTLSVKFMKQLGITKIDALIGSHLDNNHVDAHKKIIKELEVVHVYYNDDPNTCIQNKTCKGGNSANPTELAKLIKDNNIPLTVLTPGNNIKIGNLIFDCVGPQKIYTTKEHYYSDNYNSLNLILKFGNNKFYFSGDGIQEDEILAKYDKKTLDVDLFKYPHHGQQVSGEKLLSVDFVKILSPKYVMIPAKSNNLERNMKDALKEMGAEVILTGTGGNTLVESDGNNIKVVRNFSP